MLYEVITDEQLALGVAFQGVAEQHTEAWDVAQQRHLGDVFSYNFV